jgi:hypothetical protein
VFRLQSYGRQLSATLSLSTQIIGVTHPLSGAAEPVCGPDTPSKLFMVPVLRIQNARRWSWLRKSLQSGQKSKLFTNPAAAALYGTHSPGAKGFASNAHERGKVLKLHAKPGRCRAPRVGLCRRGTGEAGQRGFRCAYLSVRKDLTMKPQRPIPLLDREVRT